MGTVKKLGSSLLRYSPLLRTLVSSHCAYLIFFVTSKCNARCRTCFYWREIEQSGRRNILSLVEIEHIARHFKNLVYLSITGGEPTLREDLDEIVCKFYTLSGTVFTNITTNGLLPEKTELFTRSILQKCPHLNLKINLSIDHIGISHDEIRGVNGAFAKALETFSRLGRIKRKNDKLILSIGTVLSSYNKADIYKIIDYVRDELRPDMHAINLARGDTREKDAKEVTVEEFKKVIEYLKTDKKDKRGPLQAVSELMMEVHLETLKRQNMILPCVAGKNILTLTDDGYIVPCEILHQNYPEGDYVLGDIRKAGYDINSILRSPKYKEVVRWIKRSKCRCTFECATFWNIITNVRMYPKILTRSF